jgi:dolichyl-phosphate-mannose--protein O-mannosyl transferase
MLIGLAGLILRLVYFPYDVPLFNDSQGYFWYAIDMSVLNQLPLGHSLVNNGWPSFLSLIFQQMDSSNFLDYHNMQRFVGVVFSVATIFPVYLLCSRYFKKTYSLLGATLFIFEPRLIGNSLLGIPESMYVFLMASLLFLFLSNDFKKIYLAFAIVALLAIVGMKDY